VRAHRDTDAELERLYRDEGARLWRALVAFSGDREVAADAVAEAFARALAHMRSYVLPPDLRIDPRPAHGIKEARGEGVESERLLEHSRA
jgi:DNA-directed RNA polymerase specialized sigma24 family protein